MTSDPSIHRQREQDFMQHVQRLLSDDRLRLDTTRGRRVITSLRSAVTQADHSVDLKRLMTELNRPDRDLQNQMPIGQTLDVALSQRKFLLFNSVVGRLKVICVSPSRALICGQSPQPLGTADVQKILSEIPPSLGGVPSTVVLMSTGGFTLEAHELADRRADRTVILAEPNQSGGWAVYGPVETKSLVDLFDPEAEEAKRTRIRVEIEAGKMELSGSGVAGDKIAAKTRLPLQLVESELKSFARSNPGLAARRLDGRLILFREGNVPANQRSQSPLIEKLKTIFSRKGENEKKIAFLSERRAALSQQRDRSYEELAALEKQDVDLRGQFQVAPGELTKRRITGQLLQLRKDISRRQQLLSVLNQQADVVATHLHNLELVQQGQTARLPDGEEMAEDAAKAEEMLAELQADSELASSMSAVATTSVSQEEQALYDELQNQTSAAAESVKPPAPPIASPNRPASAPQPRKAEAEPG